MNATPLDPAPGGAGVMVNEIYRSLSGESTRAGEPCTLVRLTGCGLRCGYCDTAYAFHAGTLKTVRQVVEEVAILGDDLVLLTGGEPLEQEGALDLLEVLTQRGARVMVETGGHVDIRPAAAASTIILDVKTPGSGMVQRNHWANLDYLRPDDEVKFVLAHRDDYEWARQVLVERHPGGRRLPDICAILFSPVHGHLDPALLATWILEDRLAVRLNLQLHKILWPAATRGV